MKLYVLDKHGVWGDLNSHTLPVTVEVIPRVDIATVEIGGKTISASGGKFVINDVPDGSLSVKVNGIPCEQLFCRTVHGGTRRVNAIEQDLRGILPYLARLSALEQTVQRHENQLSQKDFFG